MSGEMIFNVQARQLMEARAALKDAERANVLLRDQLDKEMAQTEAVERENEQLRQALVKARPYVEESGPPGTGIVTTEESAERSAALLVEIDEALNHGETNETLHRTT